jgi:hypothetical protein
LNDYDRYGKQKTRYKHEDCCLQPWYRKREKIRLPIQVFQARHELPGTVATQVDTTERDRGDDDGTKTNDWGCVLTTDNGRDEDSHPEKQQSASEQ